jgi:predicted nuclease of predicted toxin-antitoxin system
MSDVEVLRLATANSRVLITFDMDFGGLIFRRGLKVPGLILLRFTPHSASEVAERILNVVRRDLPVAGHLVVIGRDMVRTVNIPERQ